jgi:hypothetical protein
LDAWCLPPLPVFDEVTQCFAQSASNLSRHLANLVGEYICAQSAPRKPSVCGAINLYLNPLQQDF